MKRLRTTHGGRLHVPEPARGPLRLFVGIAVSFLLMLAVLGQTAETITDLQRKGCRIGGEKGIDDVRAFAAESIKEDALAADPNENARADHARAARVDQAVMENRLRLIGLPPMDRWRALTLSYAAPAVRSAIDRACTRRYGSASPLPF